MYELDYLSQQPTPELSGDVEKIISATAPHFFYMIRMLLVNEIYMGIAKLLDPAKQGGNTNLTLETVIISYTSDKSPERVSAMCQLRKVKDKFHSGSKVRNELLAHIDYKTSLNYINEINTLRIDLDTLGTIIVCIENIIQNIAPQNTLPETIPKHDKNWLGVKSVIDRLRQTVIGV